MARRDNLQKTAPQKAPQDLPRVGVPYRATAEEDAGEAMRSKVAPYLRAVEAAGGTPVLISLHLPPEELNRLAATLDGFVLPGSGADVDPTLYGALPDPNTSKADPLRERTDWALLDHAFAEHKPVLAICYGTQLLNVYRGGTLVQDISGDLHTPIQHSWIGRDEGRPEPFHPTWIEPGSHLAELAGAAAAEVNSSHHQSVREPGRGLRVAARAPDGVIEAVECTGDAGWIVGVKWHPERQWPRAGESRAGSQGSADGLAQALFRQLLEAARSRAAAASRR
jgi:putative glutamine amidotransferase